MKEQKARMIIRHAHQKYRFPSWSPWLRFRFVPPVSETLSKRFSSNKVVRPYGSSSQLTPEDRPRCRPVVDHPRYFSREAKNFRPLIRPTQKRKRQKKWRPQERIHPRAFAIDPRPLITPFPVAFCSCPSVLDVTGS